MNLAVSVLITISFYCPVDFRTAIVLLFTAGALYNRRSNRILRHANDCEAPASSSGLHIPKESPGEEGRTQFHGRLLSRFLAAFPFLIEIWYWLLTYWVGTIPGKAAT